MGHARRNGGSDPVPRLGRCELRHRHDPLRRRRLAGTGRQIYAAWHVTTFNIAVIAGDGIGREVIPAGMDVLRRAVSDGACALEFTEFPWGCEFFRRTGTMMDADGLDRLADFDAIYLGAVGDPAVPDHVSVWELILPIRQRFDQYVNLRPMRLLPGVRGPLAGRTPADIDMICVRENSEGEYAGVGGRLHA